MADAVMITKKLGFDETELRHGLPGTEDKKRGFDKTVDLKLNLDVPSDQTDFQGNNVNKTDSPKPPTSTPLSLSSFRRDFRVVGWSPVRSYRKNVMSVQKRSKAEESGGSALVKVSMNGAPYLRKVDLKMYKTYQELSDALGRMFSSFTIGDLRTRFAGGVNEDVVAKEESEWLLNLEMEREMESRRVRGRVEIISDEGLIKVLTKLLMAALEDLSGNLVTTERKSSAEDCSDDRSRFFIDVSL
ncbi:hypothetical protein SASPL_127855 [Salvia splendens]|uniref:Auxin-responsive protein n=1 Tax=Salvia splendens TaxID=180675 RepID=A0A8X8ZMA0_SALSN|nr:hypothetical protein SASPL_127855 [Salvia splendens]